MQSIPSAFIWRRVHSLSGFWLVIFLFEHLIVNSQAALWLGNGSHFVSLVNLLQSIPYLHAVEITLIGFPLLVHIGWGVKRIFTAKANSFRSDGSTPALQEYPRNHAYTWQRLTSWILLVGIIGHVVQMRFLDYPKTAEFQNKPQWMVQITADEKLSSLARRLGVRLVASDEIAAMRLQDCGGKWLDALESFRLKENGLVASAPSSGAAMLLKVRDTFKNPWMKIAYTLFVAAAVFHAMNGFWTFLISWGAIISIGLQKKMSWVSLAGMAFLLFLGLAAIWGS